MPYAHAPQPIKQTLLQRALRYIVEEGSQVATLRLLFNITQNTVSLSIPLVTEDGICWEPAPRERTGPEASVGREQRRIFGPAKSEPPPTETNQAKKRR